MGYGPLVRATTGVSRLWTIRRRDTGRSRHGRHAFYDATTVFPDHVVGRITAIGALAALIHRDRTGTGARVHVSQAEVVVNQLDTCYVTEAALAATVRRCATTPACTRSTHARATTNGASSRSAPTTNGVRPLRFSARRAGRRSALRHRRGAAGPSQRVGGTAVGVDP